MKKIQKIHNNTGTMILSGFNQEGGTVAGNIKNLEIESLQNISKTKGYTAGGNISVGITNAGAVSGNIHGNKTNGDRNFVDKQTTFVAGEYSNLNVSNVDNTAEIIGTTDNGKIAIDNYKGKDLQNEESLTTVGGSVGTSGIGVNYSNSEKEGITRNTVVGNVSIENTNNSDINYDISKANEITKNSSISTDIYAESQLISAVANPDEFKKQQDLAKQEIKDIKEVAKNTLDNQGKDNRNFIELLNSQRRATTLNNLVGNDIANLNSKLNGKEISTADYQGELKNLVENLGKDLGLNVEVIITNTLNMPRDSKEKGGTARVDGENSTIYINADLMTETSTLIGTVFEEFGHILDAKSGRQDTKVAEDPSHDEQGLESLGRAVNTYFEETYKENSKKINLISDKKDYTNAGGVNVGDKKNEGWDIYKNDLRSSTLREDNSTGRLSLGKIAEKFAQRYTEEVIQETINKANGENTYKIDWKKYEVDTDYREQTNYYFYQAKYSVKVKTIDKIDKNSIEITKDNDEKLKLTEIKAEEAIYHNIEKINGEWHFTFGDGQYKKYVNEDGYELILDKNNQPIYDPVAVGRYNFFTYNLKVVQPDFYNHGVDVELWKKYGTGSNDPTTREEREKIGNLLFGFFIQDNYGKIENKLKNEGKEKEKASYTEINEIIFGKPNYLEKNELE